MENELKDAFENFKKGNYAPAWDSCHRILKDNPNQPDCLAMLGMMCNKAKRYSDAVSYLRKCLFFHPHKHVILTELATSLIYLEQLVEAEKLLKESIEFNTRYDKTFIQLGKLYKQTGRKAESEKTLRELLNINPHSTSAMNNLGTLLMEDNKQEEAYILLKKVIEINPQMGIAHKNIALIELKKGNKKEAENHLSIALNLLPYDTDIIAELGKLFSSQLQTKKAISFFEKVLEKDSDNTEILILTGSSYQYLKEFEKAIFYFERALKIDENLSTAFYMMARCKTDLCDWKSWDETREKYINYLENDLKSAIPFECSAYDTHYYNIPDELQFRIMKRIAEKYAQPVKPQFSFKNRSHKKIRIGYISPDFRRHATSMSIFHIFRHHNHDLFEVYTFSLHVPAETDIFQETIKNDSDYFFDISQLSIYNSAKLIYENEIDILVDLGGYTNFTKPEIMNQKPAPIQIFMIGQPDTTGSPNYDFFLSDKILIDDVNRKFYTENILYVPYGFIGSPIEPSEKNFTRQEIGISDDAFVFCSFCSPYKYEPIMFSVWMKILNTVENSVLWLLCNKNDTLKNNLLQEAFKYGINSQRIIFSDYSAIEDHLNRMKICDLFLDTLYYTSSTTGIHALMSGLPVVTLRGETNAMRQGASVCHAAHLDETICNTIEEYYEKAIELAKSPEKLAMLRTKLSGNKEQLPIFNIPYIVDNLEKSYLKIWDIYVKGEKFTDIFID
jgi:protein O-GlcNAc transferase